MPTDKRKRSKQFLPFKMGFNWITAVLEVAAVVEVKLQFKEIMKKNKRERERGGKKKVSKSERERDWFMTNQQIENRNCIVDLRRS